MAHNPHLLFEQVEMQLSINPSAHIQTIALRIGVDRHTLAQTIQAYVGVTLRDWRNANRLSKGLVLIEQSDRSFKEIAVVLGFEAFYSLSRFIKKGTGKTPGQIRRAAQLNQLSAREQNAP